MHSNRGYLVALHTLPSRYSWHKIGVLYAQSFTYIDCIGRYTPTTAMYSICIWLELCRSGLLLENSSASSSFHTWRTTFCLRHMSLSSRLQGYIIVTVSDPLLQFQSQHSNPNQIVQNRFPILCSIFSRRLMCTCVWVCVYVCTTDTPIRQNQPQCCYACMMVHVWSGTKRAGRIGVCVCVCIIWQLICGKCSDIYTIYMAKNFCSAALCPKWRWYRQLTPCANKCARFGQI